MKEKFCRYVLLAGLAFLGVALAGPVAPAAFDSLACPRAPPGWFVGYCETSGLGDYEHGAAAFALEPEFIDNLRRADVVFLGESKMQTAASAAPVAAYFQAKGLRFFALGFGFGESAAFPLMLLDRYDVHPKAVIINADGFFVPGLSLAASNIADGRGVLAAGMSRLRYLRKAVVQRIDAALCAALALRPPGPEPRSWLRSAADGRWIWFNGDPDRIVRRITPRRDHAFTSAALAAQANAAPSVIAALRLPPECIILTGVPNPQTDAEGAARALAAALDLPLAQPAIEGLAVRDEAHLNRQSAERWAAALTQAIDPLLERCRRRTLTARS